MIPFLDKTIVKLGLAAALFAGLFFAYKWWHDSVFEAGVNSVKAELAAAYEKREKELSTRLETALAENKAGKEKASRIQSDLRNSHKLNMKLRDEIHNIKDKFNCSSLGNEFQLRWNEIIGEEPKYN